MRRSKRRIKSCTKRSWINSRTATVPQKFGIPRTLPQVLHETVCLGGIPPKNLGNLRPLTYYCLRFLLLLLFIILLIIIIYSYLHYNHYSIYYTSNCMSNYSSFIYNRCSFYYTRFCSIPKH